MSWLTSPDAFGEYCDVTWCVSCVNFVSIVCTDLQNHNHVWSSQGRVYLPVPQSLYYMLVVVCIESQYTGTQWRKTGRKGN